MDEMKFIYDIVVSKESKFVVCIQAGSVGQAVNGVKRMLEAGDISFDPEDEQEVKFAVRSSRKAPVEMWNEQYYAFKRWYWIESPNCDNICSKCGRGSETYELLAECPHCHAKMHTDFCYPNVDLYEEETGLKVWGGGR